MSAPVERYVRAAGVRLRVVDEGPPDSLPVLVLHGFTGSAESMAPVAAALATRRTLRVDLVGHGRSDAPLEAAPYAMRHCVEQLAELIDALCPRPPHVLGYSMGGRAALHLAVARPRRVRSLLLIGASPGLADPGERRARVLADEALAASILDSGVEAFVERWMALPLFASQRRLGLAFLAQARRQRLRNRPHALALSLRGMGTGAQEPLRDRLPALELPVCLVAGDEDAKFQATAREMAARLPRARLAVVEKAGHAAHLENPEAFRSLALDFFDQVEATRGERFGSAAAEPPQSEETK